MSSHSELPAHDPPRVPVRALAAMHVFSFLAAVVNVVIFIAAWVTGHTFWFAAWVAWYVVVCAVVAFTMRRARLRQRAIDAAWVNRYRELAIRDDLTGLYNRRYFNEQLAGCFEAGELREVVLVLIDLNHFKLINDALGHGAGDAALRAAAAAMSAAAPPGSVVARIGGDEFALLLVGDELPAEASLARRQEAAIEAMALVYDGTPVRLRAAAGAARRAPAMDAESLLRAADDRLYARKAELTSGARRAS